MIISVNNQLEMDIKSPIQENIIVRLDGGRNNG